MAYQFIIPVSLSILAIIFYLIVLFLLFEIKRRLKDSINVSLTYLIISIFFLILIRTDDVLTESNIFTFNILYLHEILIVIFSLFLLISIIHLYLSLTLITDHKKKKR